MGTNASTQSMQTLQQGLDLFKDVTDFLGDRTAEKSGNSEAENRAALIETDAAGEAQDLRRRAEQDADEIRETREQARGAAGARWGGSNLAMSGSKALIRDAKRLQDRQEEEDALFEGEMNARSRLHAANKQANMMRIADGGSPSRSILSQGSKIYGRN